MQTMKRYNPGSSQPVSFENQSDRTDRRTFIKTTVTAATGAIIAPAMFTSNISFSHPLQKRYPDPAIIILDKSFEKYCLFNAAVECLWTGARWAEGPVWFGDGRYLLFSDIPNNRILRWTEETGKVSVFRNPAYSLYVNTQGAQIP